MADDDPTPGRYRHKNGDEYDLLGIALLEATGDALAVYRARYGNRLLWARPMREFVPPRFVPIAAPEADDPGDRPGTGRGLTAETPRSG